MGDDEALDQGNSGDGYALKAEIKGFTDGLDMEWGRRQESQITSRISA